MSRVWALMAGIIIGVVFFVVYFIIALGCLCLPVVALINPKVIEEMI